MSGKGAFHDKYSRISAPLLVDLIQNKPEIFKLTQDNRVVYYFATLQYDDSDYENIFSHSYASLKLHCAA